MLNGKKCYRVLDIRDGYYYIKLNNKSCTFCTFSTPFGSFRFLCLAFNLSKIPEFFRK